MFASLINRAFLAFLFFHASLNALNSVYVANAADDTISVIDIATNTVIATITVGNNPLGLAITPDGSRVYVPNVSSDNVSVIDTATDVVIATITAGDGATYPAVTADGTTVYVANRNSGNVTFCRDYI